MTFEDVTLIGVGAPVATTHGSVVSRLYRAADEQLEVRTSCLYQCNRKTFSAIQSRFETFN